MKEKKAKFTNRLDEIARELESLAEQLERIYDSERVDVLEELRLTNQMELLEAERDRLKLVTELDSLRRKRRYLPNTKYQAAWFVFFEQKAVLFGQKKAHELTTQHYKVDTGGDEVSDRDNFCRAYRRWRKKRT